jgi:hypothetical protein
MIICYCDRCKTEISPACNKLSLSISLEEPTKRYDLCFVCYDLLRKKTKEEWLQEGPPASREADA